MRRTCYSVLPLYLGAVLVTAAEVVYVTDLSIFTSLVGIATLELAGIAD
jgi:hypothetical protein